MIESSEIDSDGGENDIDDLIATVSAPDLDHTTFAAISPLIRSDLAQDERLISALITALDRCRSRHLSHDLIAALASMFHCAIAVDDRVRILRAGTSPATVVVAHHASQCNAT